MNMCVVSEANVTQTCSRDSVAKRSGLPKHVWAFMPAERCRPLGRSIAERVGMKAAGGSPEKPPYEIDKSS